MSLTLKRIEIGEIGAFGVLQWFGMTFAVTLEKTYPGQGNAWIPKIPPGVYKCERNRFARGGYDTWRIHGGVITPDREIKFHKGNFPDDSDGCVLVGEQFDWLSGRRAILSSSKGFAEFMTLTSEHDVLDFAVINC